MLRNLLVSTILKSEHYILLLQMSVMSLGGANLLNTHIHTHNAPDITAHVLSSTPHLTLELHRVRLSFTEVVLAYVREMLL